MNINQTPQDIIDLVNSGKELSESIRQFVDQKRRQLDEIEYDLNVEWTEDMVPVLTAIKRSNAVMRQNRIHKYLNTLESQINRLHANDHIRAFLKQLEQNGFEIEYTKDSFNSQQHAISRDNEQLINDMKNSGLCDTIAIVDFRSYIDSYGIVTTMANFIPMSDYPKMTAMVNKATDCVPNRAEIHEEYKKFLDLLDGEHIQVKYTKDQVKMHGGRLDIPNEFVLSTNLEDDNYMTNLVNHLVATSTESIQITGVRVVLPEDYPTTCIMFITFYNNRAKKEIVDNTQDQKKKWYDGIKQKLSQLQPKITNDQNRGKADWVKMSPQNSRFVDAVSKITGEPVQSIISRYLGHPTKIMSMPISQELTKQQLDDIRFTMIQGLLGSVPKQFLSMSDKFWEEYDAWKNKLIPPFKSLHNTIARV